MAPKIRVTVEHPGGTAGVVRSGHHLWLSDEVARGPVTRLDDHVPRVIGLAGDRTLEGGLLPEGAVTALVTDDAGERREAAAAGGAWAIVLEQPCEGHLSPVCFRDAGGELVVPQLPPDWSRVAVDDADEPCPACGATAWDQIHPTDGSRGRYGPQMLPTPFVACRACGHEYSGGVFHSLACAVEPSAEELERLEHEVEVQLRERGRKALDGVDFAIYVARGHAPRIGGWGGRNGETNRVTVEHGARPGEPGPALSVQTEHEPVAYASERAQARSTLYGALSEEMGPWPARSNAGLSVLLHAFERRRLAVAARASVAQRTLLVEGEPQRFELVSTGDRWVAVARRGEIVVTVTARCVDADDVELVALEDPQLALCSI
jgi:hypothetical protein